MPFGSICRYLPLPPFLPLTPVTSNREAWGMRSLNFKCCYVNIWYIGYLICYPQRGHDWEVEKGHIPKGGDKVESCICLQREAQVAGSPQEATLGVWFPSRKPNGCRLLVLLPALNDLQIYSNTIWKDALSVETTVCTVLYQGWGTSSRNMGRSTWV